MTDTATRETERPQLRRDRSNVRELIEFERRRALRDPPNTQIPKAKR
jgi:hypothetical protein